MWLDFIALNIPFHRNPLRQLSCWHDQFIFHWGQDCFSIEKHSEVAAFCVLIHAHFLVHAHDSLTGYFHWKNGLIFKPRKKEANLPPLEGREHSPRIEATDKTCGTVFYSRRSNMSLVIETALGQIVLRLLPEAAPETVKYICQLANSGLYDSTSFYRSDFVIQCGTHGTSKSNPFGKLSLNEVDPLSTSVITYVSMTCRPTFTRKSQTLGEQPPLHTGMFQTVEDLSSSLTCKVTHIWILCMVDTACLPG